MSSSEPRNLLDKVIKFSLHNRLIIFLLLAILLVWGIIVAPFDWQIPGIDRRPVPVDAIPDIGKNQQIVFTEWKGKSPQDVEDQITYPLTVSLLGIPQVETVRSFSMFGFSSIYVIFKEDADFYWSRSRILEKLNSLPRGTLPNGVQPALGPDATALGQVFWYTLEGRDTDGNPTGGWDLQELRSIQDWYVRYALQSVDGVSEVASVGGFVKEYQIDVDPGAMKEQGVSLDQIFQAVRKSNLDVGARTVEINRVEYLVRGVGQIDNKVDIENTVIKTVDNVPLYIKDVANVTLGPAQRRGILDKEGAEVVGGVVVARYGENPLATINNVKDKIKEISPGLPSKKLDDGTSSKVEIVPFYDRSGLIYETLGTLSNALRDEILITIIVILIMVMHLRTSFLITGILPLAVLFIFIGMKVFHVDANIVALSGIAIAIGTIVDMGIVVSENMLNHLNEASDEDNRLNVLYKAATEVGSAVLTAVATTVVSFLPVFTMEAAEGKLFKPLAYTKTMALIASVIIALTILPPFASLIYRKKVKNNIIQNLSKIALTIFGLILAFVWLWWAGLLIAGLGTYLLIRKSIPEVWETKIKKSFNWIIIGIVALLLSSTWSPLGYERGLLLNALFVFLLIGLVMGALILFTKLYPRILGWTLKHKRTALSIPTLLVLMSLIIWLGFGSVFGFMPDFIKKSAPYQSMAHTFPGLGKEFMPPLDEGSFLYMPTTMPHAGVGEAQDVLQKLDKALYSVPEVEMVVGKAGRADTPLDPAPLSMVETIVNYKPEYKTDKNGNRLRFAVDQDGNFKRDNKGNLIQDKNGRPFRQWRDHIRTNEDIWDELVKVAQIPGVTSAPKLQPISARIVMLQSGMRAPMGIKVKGPDLPTIEDFGLKLEKLLKQIPNVKSSAVIADRVVGKPYIEIHIDRKATARYGIPLKKVQQVIEVALGGKKLTTTIEGRERYPVRVRYMRELRDDFDDIGNTLISAPDGVQIPLKQLAEIKYVKGPQVIKSEDTFLISYVLFDKVDGTAEVDVVEQAKEFIQNHIDEEKLQVPAGVSYEFAGSYKNQIRASKKLRLILPLALFVIFLILYFQFNRISTTFIVFTGIIVAWAGGFLLLWFYGQDWFLNFNFLGMNMRTLFQIQTVNLSVAVWVGFLALFGIASDNGVIISTYLDQHFNHLKPGSIPEIHTATIEAATRRIRPAMMTASTTILALLPVLTSTGRGSDIMVPMAIPSFGGMLLAIISTFVVPILYTIVRERQLKKYGELKYKQDV
ncbi:MAG TPA: efflux RND transporter permease subunit [bacterium]|nr:efflux RND transporter permease subunit [bacterium]